MNFINQTVLITGGSRGIGRATAQAFAEKGARVAINFHSDNDAARATIESLPGEGHFAIRADLGNPTAVEQMMAAVIGEFGRLNILVNNAGIFKLHPITEVSYGEWQEVWQNTLSINLTGAANATYCAARHMIQAGGGRIINVSSRGAFRGEPDQPAYGASKAAMNAMGQSLAQALAPYQVFVGTVAPGFVETDMTKDWLEGPSGESIRQQSPLKRVARPEEVAQGILFLAAPGSEFMTGAILDINGASYLRS